jgi:3-isopropylmalate/(R)-2-methylmalate dehydratase small subunit
MEPLIKLTSRAVPLPLANINTDQLFPARFIKKPRAVGYAQYLFHDIRRTDDEQLSTEFPLNQAKFNDSKILVAGPNFGSGSSREGAVYALYDSGFRAILAPSFGEIFASNCLKNGMLTARLNADAIHQIQTELTTTENPELSIDVAEEALITSAGTKIGLDLDPFQKHCLMNGLNEIDLSLEFDDAITQFESDYRKAFPWITS